MRARALILLFLELAPIGSVASVAEAFAIRPFPLP